jgi:hypothetical protein
MAAKKKTEVPPVDEFARGIFHALGFGDNPPEHIAEMYHTYKRVKDIMQPSRLSPEGFATVVMLAELKQAATPRRGRPPASKDETQDVEVEDDVQDDDATAPAPQPLPAAPAANDIDPKVSPFE